MKVTFAVCLAGAALVVGCKGGPDPLQCGSERCQLPEPPVTSGTTCCDLTKACVRYDLDRLCPDAFICDGPGNVALDSECVPSCVKCVRKPPLAQGMLATHLDVKVDPHGAILLSGYNPGVPPDREYGDLVFGLWQPSGGAIRWNIVDGAPDGPVVNDPSGWRGGVTEPGPDVGRWTSLEVSESSTYISYYDASSKALKLAVLAGGEWTISTVDEQIDAGRYSSLILDAEDRPIIAYMAITASDPEARRLEGHMKIATATQRLPSSDQDWVFQNVHTVAAPCRPEWCPAGTTCLEEGLCVTATEDCPEACASGQTCVDGHCRASLPGRFIEEFPPSTGLFADLATMPDGSLSLVFYDRTSGRLFGAQRNGQGPSGRWGNPFVIDGGGHTAGSLDAGTYPSLAIDSDGTWHISYIDRTQKRVRYARRRGGRWTYETIDDGSTNGTGVYAEGAHYVDASTDLLIRPDGVIQVVYQDTTAQHARIARRSEGGDSPDRWRIDVLDTQHRTGYWLRQALFRDVAYVVTFWRNDREAAYGTRVLRPQN